METVTKALYDTDFVEWADETARLLRAGRFGEVDLEHLVEEVADLGKSQRAAVRSELVRMVMHLIKRRLQPERAGASWRKSISGARIEIALTLEDSPSLKPYLEAILEKVYQRAAKEAIRETKRPERSAELPAECHGGWRICSKPTEINWPGTDPGCPPFLRPWIASSLLVEPGHRSLRPRDGSPTSERTLSILHQLQATCGNQLGHPTA